ncbi:MAG: hypothetical protein LBR70_05955 [Lactobacillaceae bacterium]|jgi:hypothetical protein|nr:hypothetical protein [Lactobacillaceae bacterium]
MTNKTFAKGPRIFTRHNMIVFAAMAVSIASDVPDPPDNNEPLLVKDELTLSSIANKPSSGASRGTAGGDNSFLKEGKKLEYESGDLLDSMLTAKVPLRQTAQFFINYKNNLDEEGKITSNAFAQAAKDAKITSPQFKLMVEALRDITRTKKLDIVSKADVNGYDYFDNLVDFRIDDKGEPRFTTQVTINNIAEYSKDIETINKAIQKTRKFKTDNINFEAHNLIIKAFVCAKMRKIIDDGRDTPNSDKLFKNFEQDLKDYKLTLGENGKLQRRTETIKLNPAIQKMWSLRNSYRAAG